MKPAYGENIVLRYRPADDTEPVTIRGKLVRIENDKNLGIRTSAKKIRWVRSEWVLDWRPADDNGQHSR